MRLERGAFAVSPSVKALVSFLKERIALEIGVLEFSANLALFGINAQPLLLILLGIGDNGTKPVRPCDPRLL
jgi:hypothetical protein